MTTPSSRGKNFYLTTTIPYVNAEPHIGFALEAVHADIIARYKKLLGFNVFFNTGTDEHGIKVYRKAIEEGKDPQSYVNEYAKKYQELLPRIGISGDVNFIRTTDSSHTHSAREFWRRCFKSGDIYKKNYQIKYCVGCELEKTESELTNGHCVIHPNLRLEIINEENYFFRLSKYQDKLLALYDNRKDFVLPDFRLNEIRSLIKNKGLEDFSISRLRKKMPWGVAVPEDDEQVMYVWFDAFVNYISAIGWPDDEKKFKQWWLDTGGVVQFAGKDQVRQQAVMWQAMLMSAGLSPSRQIIIHGFITSGGEKISKSLGNVVDPVAIVNEYGTDALRYYLGRHIHPFEDSDFTMEKFKEAYNANLANGLGNLASRVMKMSETHLSASVEISDDSIPQDFKDALEKYDIQAAANAVWRKISKMDEQIQKTEPFKLIKTDRPKAEEIIRGLVADLRAVAGMLSPILPETAEKIKQAIKENKMPGRPLFPRKG